MKQIADVRAEIDGIDEELARLFARRMEIVGEIAACKRAQGAPVFDPVRERAVLAHVAEEAGPEYAEDAKRLFAAMFEVSKARQQRILERDAGVAPRAAAKGCVAVAGLGLIGGSIYKAALAAGYDAIGLHHGESEGLEKADFVFVAQPPEAIAPWVRANAARFRAGAVVVDVCGVKTEIVEAVRAVPKNGWHFVGGHPMAGREVSGYANSSANLFRGASMVLTPDAEVPAEVVARLKAFFADLGFKRTVTTTAARHDATIAFTSQLGHVIATAYSRDPAVADAVGFAAGSFANMTRIATMDPATWSALYLAAPAPLLAKLDGLLARLGEFRAALAAGDRAAIERMIAEGAEAKRRVIAAEGPET